MSPPPGLTRRGLPRRWLPYRLLGGAALAALGLSWGALPALGQGFDPEREALDARSRIEFTYSSLAADSSTEVGGERADQTSSRHEGTGAFAGWAAGPFFAGGGGQSSLFREETPDFKLRVRRESAGASASLRLGPLVTIASSGYSVFDSEIDDIDSSASIEFKVELIADSALGLYLDVGPLRLGYSHSWERMKLDFDESTNGTYRERYRFERDAYYAALGFGEGAGFQFSAGTQRSESPSRGGNEIDYGGSDEISNFGSIGYGFDKDNRVYLSLSHSMSEARFDDLLDIETTERALGVGLELKSGLSLSLSQSEKSDTQAFAPAMGLREVTSATTSLSARVGWRF